MLLLRNFLLFVSILSLTQAGLAFPMDNEPAASSSSSHTAQRAAPSTPAAAAAAAAPVVDETPGQLLSRRQARVLQCHDFERIVGAQIVATWGISWDVFQDLSSPSTSDKLLNLHRLVFGMKQLSLKLQENEDFNTLYGKVLVIKDQLEAVHLERLQGVTERYFQTCFPGSKVTFGIKFSGVQLGTIATVTEPSGQTHKFYVKTHSEGKLADKSSAAKTVDPRELLVYKVLEKLGLGCESHFLARSPEDVYIATRDASEGATFVLLKSALEGKAKQEAPLWGASLEGIHDSLAENNWQATEESLATDPLSHNFAHQIVTLDILSRLLRLHDFLNNTENFGFSRTFDQPYRVRVLDFRLHDNIAEFDESYFRSFLAGNGLFHYAAAHKILGFLLHDRLEPSRVATALWTFQHGNLRDLEPAVDRAYEDVVRYIRETNEFSAHRDKFLSDLTSYQEIIKRGHRCFRECLVRYVRETLDTQSRIDGGAAAARVSHQ